MRIAIADDHTLVRKALGSLFELHGMTVVGEASDGQAAVALARAERPDIFLMDLSMPGMNGILATRLISAELPAVKVVVLTASEDDDDLFEAIASGAQGYLPKNIDLKEFLALLEGIAHGEAAFTPSLARKVLSMLTATATRKRGSTILTAREQEVLGLLTQGVTSNRDLAASLFVTENTVKYHLRMILRKLHVRNRAHVVAYAVRHGLVDKATPS